MSQNAAVHSNLSTRARQLSQRRTGGRRHNPGQAVDLAGQDQPLDNRESGLWVPASQHQAGSGSYQQEEEDEEEEEEEDAGAAASGVVGPNGEQRGREEERPVAA